LNDRIFREAQKARKLAGSNDPFELLEALHAVVRPSALYAADGLRGFCAIMNRTRYVVINQKQPEEEQRVTAAHEGGHLILHSDILRAAPLRDFDIYNATGRLERQANFFAAEYMIDDEAVLDLMHSHDADFFDVSQTLCIPAPFFAFKLYSMIDRGYPMRMPVDLDSTFLKGRR